MQDQATQLRRLVLSSAAHSLAGDEPPPPLVVVSGSKGGVGTTTISVNLAVMLSKQGHRVVLVDANFHQPDAAVLCQLEDEETITDVLSGHRTVHEVLQRGPAGIQVLPGPWAPNAMIDYSSRAQDRLIAELARLGPHADLVIIDAGSGMNPTVRRFWQAASLVLLLTTPDSISVMDAYAAIKVSSLEDVTKRIWTVVNRLVSNESRDDVHGRIRQACHRFLNVDITCGPSIPSDPVVGQSAHTGRPFVIREPASPASRMMEALSDQVADTVGTCRVSSVMCQVNG